MPQSVFLISFTYPHEAHMAANYLESEGVKTYIQDELTVQVDNFYSNAIGGVKIYVDESDSQIGQALLIKGGYIQTKPSKAKPEVVYLSANTNKKECPFCKSKNIGIDRTPHIISIVLMFIIHALFPFFKKNYYCFNCQKQWRYKT